MYSATSLWPGPEEPYTTTGSPAAPACATSLRARGTSGASHVPLGSAPTVNGQYGT